MTPRRAAGGMDAADPLHVTAGPERGGHRSHTCACGGTCPHCAAKQHPDEASDARNDAITIGARGIRSKQKPNESRVG